MNKSLLYTLSILSICTMSFGKPNHCKMSNHIVERFATKMKTDNDFRLEGKGGAMMCDIQQVDLQFGSPQYPSIDDARQLYITATQELIGAYNADLKIRPYLHEYPFTISNIKLTIRFSGRTPDCQDTQFVALIFTNKHNVVYYEGYNFQTEEFFILHTESYEEALSTVQQQPCPSISEPSCALAS